MNVFHEKSRSCWMEVEPKAFPALQRNETADVVVIGSGIAGLSTAYELARRGSIVIVLDRGPIARGMTARTTAHLTSALDDFYKELIKIRGEGLAKTHFASQASSIDRIDRIRAEEGIDCDFARLDAFLFLAPGDDPKILDEESAACRKVGFRGVGRVARSPLKSWQAEAYLRFPEQGRFHPVKYVDGLATAIERRAGRLFADTCVTEVKETEHGVTVKTMDGHTVSAEAAVVATNAPINDRITIHAKQAPYRTYVLAGLVEKGSIPDALYWDTEEPYHYVRLHPWGDVDLLLVGGEDHKTGQADDADERFSRLEEWGRERFPLLKEVRYRWSGQVMDTIDYVAFIGRNPGNDRIYVATGDSGQGITHGVVAGMLLSDLILDGTSRWSDVYEPARKPLRAVSNFLSEGLSVAANLTEHITGGEIEGPEELDAGEGGLLRLGLSKFAVCRDEQGKVHSHSATCTHAGCVIHWNSFEQCWDCPCHGSHFAADGTALNGPAIEPLTPAEKRLEPEKDMALTAGR